MSSKTFHLTETRVHTVPPIVLITSQRLSLSTQTASTASVRAICLYHPVAESYLHAQTAPKHTRHMAKLRHRRRGYTLDSRMLNVVGCPKITMFLRAETICVFKAMSTVGPNARGMHLYLHPMLELRHHAVTNNGRTVHPTFDCSQPAKNHSYQFLYHTPSVVARGAINDAKITVCVGRHNNVELRDSHSLKLRLRGATRSGRNEV
ncbi:hypothetical protein PILCRDRAFT_200 [Piloderma croceum F 1598]|uniref:Uncharacterized protein n=1 Tax=Piloderma croceum (strain F 1598) TaxID=765440 RepID=A0A0C3GNG1_PILCF|nr:hypothetical protein PILCRDRAFT_200 [Piloderma croceum F 1598]